MENKKHDIGDTIGVVVSCLLTLAFVYFLFLMAAGISNSPAQQAGEKARRYHERMENEKWTRLNAMSEDDPRWANVYDKK